MKFDTDHKTVIATSKTDIFFFGPGAKGLSIKKAAGWCPKSSEKQAYHGDRFFEARYNCGDGKREAADSSRSQT
jgi:hypothetical protein